MPGGDDEIDEATLKTIARETGGQAFRARDTEALAGIYAELDRIEPVKQEGKRVQPRIERYWWPLAGALLVALQQAPDHPVHPAIAETDYLKGFVLRVLPA